MAQSVSDTWNKNFDFDGNISVTALQQGGDRTAIDMKLDGAIKTCRLSNMAECVEVSKRILDYAQKNFGEGAEITNKTVMVPLGIGFTSWEPIENIGLQSPPSTLSDNVAADRQVLGAFYDYFAHYVDVTRPLIDDTVYKRVYRSVKTLDQELIDGVGKAHQVAADIMEQLLSMQGGGSICYYQP